MTGKCKLAKDATSSGHARLSCGCGATLVRQPFMNDSRWAEEAREFTTRHGGRWACPECGNDDDLCEHVCLECRRPCLCGTCNNGYCEQCCDLLCAKEE